MRLLVLLLFAGTGALYSLAAVQSYVEETRARPSATSGAPVLDEPSRHPEANLRRLRAAFASDDYNDELKPYLERALIQAPTFYQPFFLVAAFHANRLESPDLVQSSFEAAIARFPSNGRLHLTYAEWLLTPRVTAPYRAFRVSDDDDGDARARAMQHLTTATSLEPELSRQALDVMVRFGIPVDRWTDVLPADAITKQWILRAADRAPGGNDATRRELLATFLVDARDDATLRTLVHFARRWQALEIALAASERWHESVLLGGRGSEVTEATLSLARLCLDTGNGERAWRVLRSTLKSMKGRGLVEDSAELLVGMGDTYLARRQVATAESLFTEAVTSFPYHVRAHLGLARSYRSSGNHDGAIRELRRVIELDPDHREARALLDASLEPR